MLFPVALYVAAVGVVMKLHQLTEIATRAILANYKVRNIRCFADQTRHERLTRTRRGQIREWIGVLRVVRAPAARLYVERALRDTGPLMAHDLRSRVLGAGLDCLRELGTSSQIRGF